MEKLQEKPMKGLFDGNWLWSGKVAENTLKVFFSLQIHQKSKKKSIKSNNFKVE